MKKGSLHWLVGLFLETFEELRTAVSMKEIEDLSLMVHKHMTLKSRNYHNLDHVISLLEPNDPIQSLAALFHDIVYYQVDRGISPDIWALLSPYIVENQEEIWISTGITEDDRLGKLTMGVFGVTPGQRLQMNSGLNEFLSALFMNRRLGNLLLETDLLKVSACIEATIPFRGPDANGNSSFDLLEERLLQINQDLGLNLSPDEIEQMVIRAVLFANKDVSSFAEEVHGKFLEDNWKLIPESNYSIRSNIVYSIRDYRQALQKMVNFLGSLELEHVFHSYKGVPDEKTLEKLLELTRSNIVKTSEYIWAKLVTAGILEALAEISGGDAPLALFMGGVYENGDDHDRLENFLPHIKTSNLVDRNSYIFKLLDIGRPGKSNFDLQNSPLTLFIYKSLGPREVKQLENNVRQFFSGDLAPREFLEHVDSQVIAAVAKACAVMVVTRRKELLEYARTRESGQQIESQD